MFICFVMMGFGSLKSYKLCNITKSIQFNRSLLTGRGLIVFGTHRIAWLSQGGADSIKNTVTPRPNCRRKLHVLDMVENRTKLIEKNHKVVDTLTSMRLILMKQENLNHIHVVKSYYELL